MTKREQMIESADKLEDIMIKIGTSHSSSFYASAMWWLCKAIKLLLDAAIAGEKAPRKLTIEEKRNVIRSYCISRNCIGCPVHIGGWERSFCGTECLHIANATERDLDRALELITGGDENA